MYTPHRPSLSTIASYDSREYHDQAPLKRTNTAMTSKSSEKPPSVDTNPMVVEEPQILTYDYHSKLAQPTVTSVSSFTSIPAQQTQATSTTAVRPPMARIPSVQTRYMEMLLHLDQIPRFHNILAGIFTWLLLAGFLVVPGTFTSFRNSDAFKDADENDANKIAHAIVHGIANIGLLWLSGIFCLVGGAGCLILWFVWRKNYVWLINKIFLPALLNSVAGLLTTVVNVYTAQKGVWSVTAKITAIITSSCVGVIGLLFIAYNFWILEKVREVHERELGPVEHLKQGEKKSKRTQNAKKRESLVEKVKRKATEPSLVPGSVV